MRIYISGSISDGGTLGPEEIESRIEAFHTAESALTQYSVEVLNPARHGSGEDKTWLDYMRLALVDISQADAIATLPGWDKSRGARIEVGLARDLGVAVGSLSDWLNLLSTPVVEAEEEPSQPRDVDAQEPPSPSAEESPNG